MVLVVKNPPAKAGDVIEVARYLGREDPLEKGMVTHSSILAWRILWTEEPGGLQSIWSQESDTTELLLLGSCGHCSLSRTFLEVSLCRI